MCGKVIDGVELGDDEFLIPMDEFLIVPDFPVDGLEVMGLDGFPGDAVFGSKRNFLGVEASMMRIPDPFLMDERRGILDTPALLLELFFFFLKVMDLVEEPFQGKFNGSIL